MKKPFCKEYEYLEGLILINSKNEASFITIIKNMWRINEEVLEDMFPGFLDKEALAFLIEVFEDWDIVY